MTAAREVLGALRLEDGRRWIEAAHDFQLDDATAVLDGAEPYNYLTRSRGSSKTTDLAAAALSALLSAQGRVRAYWLAADADQGRLAIDCVQGFVARTEPLSGRVWTCRRGACWCRRRALHLRCRRPMRRALGA